MQSSTKSMPPVKMLIGATLLVLWISAVQGSSPRWEPQIAVLCEAGQAYHPQHLSEEGRWTTDLNMKSSGNTCLRDKIDLLDHCKRVYPGRDITNIVESSHYQKIGGWCRQGAMNAAKCKGAQRWIKPFRCLEGPFQSDALLVPEGCLFDHIHNASRCWPFGRWNQTGAAACQDRGMQMRSFAMLLPCGISLFSGVEFVCCPKHFKASSISDSIKVKKTDLPVVPPSIEQQQPPQLPATKPDLLSAGASSLADSSSDSASDFDSDAAAAAADAADAEDDDAFDDESDEDMMADEAAGSSAAGSAVTGDLGDDDYDSEEDADDATAAAAAAVDRDGGDSGADEDDEEDVEDGDSDSWDSVAEKSKQVPTIKEVTTTSSTTSTTTSATPTTGAAQKDDPAASAAAAAEAANIDPYFTHFDPRAEHQSYKDAQQRLEETHREKVTRVMKDWSDLEEKYQDMRLADPKSAQTFKQRMTARFQALEEEGNAEKHQMAAMHQQRVLAHINQRKREAMNCYTQALIEQPPSAHRVEKCLQKLLRALHKDRAHALAHYRHLLSSGGAGGLEAAASERPRTLERLVDIDRAVNQSMSMLKRYPDLSAKLAQLMDDYIQALRSKDDTPGSMLGMTESAEASILDKYREEIERKVAEKERQRIAEKQRKEARSQEREKLRDDKLRAEAKKLEVLVKQEQAQKEQKAKEEKEQQQQAQTAAAIESETTDQDAQLQTERDFEPSSAVVVAFETTPEPGRIFVDETAAVISSNSNGAADLMRPLPTAMPTVDDAAVQRAVEEVAAAVSHQEVEPRAAHVMGHDLGHGEAAYAIRHEAFSTAGHSHEGRNVYFTMVFAGVAVMGAAFVGVVVSRWRSARHPHSQGFVEVDQSAGVPVPVTPEEKHVVNMQINGYENPTYKYFEVKE